MALPLFTVPMVAALLAPELARLPLQPGVWAVSDASAAPDAGTPVQAAEVLIRAAPGGQALLLEGNGAFEVLTYDLPAKSYRLAHYGADGTVMLEGKLTGEKLVLEGHDGEMSPKVLRRSVLAEGDAITVREEVGADKRKLVVRAVTRWERRSVRPTEPGHATGIGGVFFKAADAKALRSWYHEKLGLPLGEGGWWIDLRWREADDPARLARTVWAAFKKDAKHFDGPFMINYRVDDLAALLERLAAAGIQPEKTEDEPGNGRFAWIRDPEGNRIELWEPPPGE